MGLSTTVSAAFLTIILITGASYVVALNVNMMRTSTEPLDEYMSAEYDKTRESCEIDSLSNKTSQSILLNLTNDGSRGILLSDFNKLDVIIIYDVEEIQKTQWLPFCHDGTTSNSWNVTRVFTNGEPGDYINPINLSKEYGIWDPGETIEIKIKISEVTNNFVYFKIVFPKGNVFSSSLI